MSMIRNMSRTYFGFIGKDQGPLFMVWTVYYDDTGYVTYGHAHFNSRDWIGV